jgi:hypothetical protein
MPGPVKEAPLKENTISTVLGVKVAVIDKTPPIADPTYFPLGRFTAASVVLVLVVGAFVVDTALLAVPVLTVNAAFTVTGATVVTVLKGPTEPSDETAIVVGATVVDLSESSSSHPTGNSLGQLKSKGSKQVLVFEASL